MNGELYYTDDHKLICRNENGIEIPFNYSLIAVVDRVQCILDRAKKENPSLPNRAALMVAYYNHIITKEEYEFAKEYL